MAAVQQDKLTTREVAEFTGFSPEKIGEWVRREKDPLPSYPGDRNTRLFDEAEVADWLQRNKIAQPAASLFASQGQGEAEVATTWAELARLVGGVNERTLQKWAVEDPMFPSHRPASPGKRDGEFVVATFRRYVRERLGGITGEAARVSLELRKQKLLSQRLKNQQLEGSLVEFDVLFQESQRIMALAVAQLDNLVPRVIKALGDGLTREQRAEVRQVVELEVRSTKATVAQLIRGEV